MLTRVQFENYRGFKSYAMEGLARVNLLVGKNNSGKTALLEGLQFLTSAGNPEVLADAAQRRGEVVDRRNGAAGTGEPQVAVDIAHFFSGHHLMRGAGVRLTGLVAGGEEINAWLSVAEAIEKTGALRRFLEVGSSGSETDRFQIARDGGVDLPSWPPPWGLVQSDLALGRKGVFVGSGSAEAIDFVAMWSELVFRGLDADVAAVLRLLDERIESIHVLPAIAAAGRFPRQGGVVVGIKGQEARVPMGSLGDGTRRLLVLATALTFVKHDPLFVDEIDAGLHYSIMPDMWRMVVARARASGTQVFATTHSWDCLEGLSQVCREAPSMAAEIAVHKISTVLPHSVAFTGESLGRMLRSDIDPR